MYKHILFILFFVVGSLANGQNVVASFQVPTNDSICVNNQITLLLTGSTGDSIQIKWGEGLSETVTAPYNKVAHVYSTTGVFTLTITAYDQPNPVAVGTLTITVLAAPMVDFSYSFSDPCAKPNINVQFTNQSVAGLFNFSWNFGDGTIAGTSTLENPTYSYAQPGGYVVSLTAQNTVCSNTKSKPILFPNDSTLVSAINYTVGCPCNSINFSAPGTATNWTWYFGDGATASGQNVAHAFPEPGEYLVSVVGSNTGTGCEYKKATLLTVCSGDINIGSSKSNNNWFFFNNNGLDFSGANPVFVGGGQMNPSTGEGGATISDPKTGALLFYTNGQTIYNANHAVMTNGNGILSGVSATESALIIPNPGNIKQYYVFTSSGASSGSQGYRYSIVDMSLSGGLGSVTTKNAALFLKSGFQSEVLKGAVKKVAENCNLAEYWVIVPTSQDTFRTYLVSSSGIAAPVISSLANPAVAKKMNRAVMGSAISPNRRMYAVIEGTVSSTQYNRIRLVDFDLNTGILSNQQIIEPGIEQLYGIAFSPDNTKLYAGGKNYIIQIDLTNNNFPTYIPVSGLVASMQLAPNNKVYFVRPDSTWLSEIQNPNNPGLSCNLIVNSIYMNGNKLRYGLQNAAPIHFSIPDTAQSNLSVNLTPSQCSLTLPIVNLSDTLSKPPCTFYTNDTLRYQWSFGDGGTSNVYNPGIHTYSVAGTYSVQLVVSRPRTCTADTFITTANAVVPPAVASVTLSSFCDSTFFKNNWYLNSSTVLDTLIAASYSGCDSVVQYNLVIHKSNNIASISTIVCGGYTSPAGKIYTQSGIYKDTIATYLGCDSIITINLSVTANAILNNSLTASCDSVLFKSKWYYTNQVVSDTAIGVAPGGCDSIVNTTIQINNSIATNGNVNICNGQSVFIHGISRSTSGVYSGNFLRSNGCDSISNINLSVLAPIQSTVSVSACDSAFVKGAWQYTSQLVKDTLFGASATGCDSIVVTDITILTAPIALVSPVTASVYPGNSLVLQSSLAAAYLWDGGETTASITITPTQNDDYCVKAFNGSCFDTACAFVYVLDCDAGKLFIPNAFSPNGDKENDVLCIYGTECFGSFEFSVYDRWGALVFKTTDLMQCWDGTDGGKKLNTAAFSFSFIGITKKQENVQINGTINLVR
ncbi:MAG: PKD domain-containing protein [Bacteroidetes bacterium]|nr:PKD domain-containing protein [Bacteroidota bacterium]